ncbi:TolC family protein [Oligoflexus tunisiensis]|uniref:TolC family protein n=1 Tax=Oligoflexus tunisiensis TaxID=708132 RepID=UPI00114CA7E9|nr:TolC family protein [Oligoflexus tunisiensis]
MKTLITPHLVLLIALYAPLMLDKSWAAEASLGLEAVIQKALASNAELKALQSELDANKAQIGPAGTLDDPMLSVEMMNVPTNSFRLNESEMSGVQVSLSQKFPYPGKLEAQQEVATLRSEALVHRLKQMQLEIAWNVKRIYYELYLRTKKKNILENQRTYLRQTLTTSRSRYALGQVSQASILNLQVEEAQLVNEQLRLSSEMKDLEAELAHISGHADHSPRMEFQSIQIDRINLNKWTDKKIAEKVMSSSALRALQSEVMAGDASVALAKKSYLPDFELMASYTIREKAVGMATPGNGQDMMGAKIGLSLPIWGATKQSQQIKEALAGKEKSAHYLDHARLMQIHEARALLAELKESIQRIDLFESGLMQLSRQAVATGTSAYLTGKESYSTLLDALKQQQETEYGYQEALVAYQLQLAKLEALIGQSLGK